MRWQRIQKHVIQEKVRVDSSFSSLVDCGYWGSRAFRLYAWDPLLRLLPSSRLSTWDLLLRPLPASRLTLQVVSYITGLLNGSLYVFLASRPLTPSSVFLTISPNYLLVWHPSIYFFVESWETSRPYPYRSTLLLPYAFEPLPWLLTDFQ